MKVSFKLSMPNVGSWNGRWTGDGKEYYIVKSFKRHEANRLLGMLFHEGKKHYSHYDFGDGWSAGVTAELIDTSEAKRRQKLSNGFCGYDWMVDEIIMHGRILTKAERNSLRKTAQAG